jgi:hypothetical protein
VALLCIFTISLIVFVSILSLYLQNPVENRPLFQIALIPYYLALLIFIAFLVYLSPALLDKVNGIPYY